MARGWAVSPVVANPRIVAAHVDRCLACQAAAARERSLERALAALGSNIEFAPTGLVSSVVRRVGASPVAPAAEGGLGSIPVPPRSSSFGWVVRHNRQVAAASASAMALGVAMLASRRSRAVGA
jgi:hypothetical protein